MPHFFPPPWGVQVHRAPTAPFDYAYADRCGLATQQNTFKVFVMLLLLSNSNSINTMSCSPLINGMNDCVEDHLLITKLTSKINTDIDASVSVNHLHYCTEQAVVFSNVGLVTVLQYCNISSLYCDCICCILFYAC